jgi:hypothetical protein
VKYQGLKALQLAIQNSAFLAFVPFLDRNQYQPELLIYLFLLPMNKNQEAYSRHHENHQK